MKIGLLVSFRWKKECAPIFEKMMKFFKDKGHKVVTSDISVDQLHPLGYVEREKIFMRFYEKLEACDVVFAECSLQSTQVGFGLSYLRSKGKPIVILSHENMTGMSVKGEVYSNVENLAVFEYNDNNFLQILAEALSILESRIDKRFTIIFPADLMAQLEDISLKKHLPKSVYIRNIIENALEKDLLKPAKIK